MIDVHAHLCLPEFDSDREEVVEESRKHLSGVIVSSARYEEGLCVLDLVEKHQGFLFASLGFHPTEGTRLEETIRLIKANASRLVAIGEVGMDFHWETRPGKRELQKKTLGKFISLGKELKKPLVLHTWDAEEEVFDLVKNSTIPPIFHCFTGRKDLAEEIVGKGFYVSLSTNLLFSKSLQRAAKSLPQESILLETDSPFLDPDRTRRRNTPGNILLSAEKLASLRKEPLLQLKRQLLENTKKAFLMRV